MKIEELSNQDGAARWNSASEQIEKTYVEFDKLMKDVGVGGIKILKSNVLSIQNELEEIRND